MKLCLMVALVLGGATQALYAAQIGALEGQNTVAIPQAASTSPTSSDPTSTAEPLYVDVRSWVENQVDAIEGHTHIHYLDIASEIRQYAQSKEQEIYLYCAVGGRAEKARESLMSIGYTNVVNLGGIEDVKESLNPE